MAKAQQKKEETQNKTNQQAETALPAQNRQNDLRINRDTTSPFTLMRHIAEDMENMMADFGLGGRMFSPGFSRNPFGRNFSLFEETPFFMERENFPGEWSPQVDMFERNGNLIVQAELPGVKKDDVKVEIVGNQLTIEGERKEESEEKGEGFYRSERSYGSFYRMLPLPEGINTENAKATFNDGVLEISMASPKLTQAAKRLEITEAEPKKAASNK